MFFSLFKVTLMTDFQHRPGVRFSKLLKSFRARKVSFFSLFNRLPLVFRTNFVLNVFFNLGKLKLFSLSKLSKLEFLVMNFVYLNGFFGFDIFSGV